MTIKDIERVFQAGNISEEFLNVCKADSRKAVQVMVRRYEKTEAERARVKRLYAYEESAWAGGAEFVAGIDEAGRGPLAGPLCVATVILPRNLFLPKINDSKKLSAKAREELFELILNNAISCKVLLIDAETIDKLNIYQATMQGMYDVVAALDVQPDYVLVDAMPLKSDKWNCQSIIKGDAKSISIAAASILAKVTRDREMVKYDEMYPEYGFAKHKGYGTAEHIEALKKYGPCPLHRKTFEPVKTISTAKIGK